MSSQKLSNISLSKLRKFLKACGLNEITINKGRGGHEKWSKLGMDRPIMFQSHIDPVPEFIIQQILRHLNLSRDEFFKIFNDL